LANIGFGDLLGIEGQLDTRAARHFAQMNLRRICEWRGDPHLAPYGMPSGEIGATKVVVTITLSARDLVE